MNLELRSAGEGARRILRGLPTSDATGPDLRRLVCMAVKIRNSCWPWVVAVLLAGCGTGSGTGGSTDPDSGAGPTRTCFPTQCDVEYQQCPKPHILCDQCWDTCRGVDADLAAVCVRTCTDVCTHESEDSSCGMALTQCRATPKNKVCLEGISGSGGVGSSAGPGASAQPAAVGGFAAQGGSSGYASAPMSLPGAGASAATESGAGGAGNAAGGTSGPSAGGAPSAGGPNASGPSASGSGAGGGSGTGGGSGAAPSGRAGTSGNAGEVPAPHA